MHRLQTILIELAESERPVAWINRCWQFLYEFDLEAVRDILSGDDWEGGAA